MYIPFEPSLPYDSDVNYINELSKAVITMLNGGFSNFEANIDFGGFNVFVKIHLETANLPLYAISVKSCFENKQLENGEKLNY